MSTTEAHLHEIFSSIQGEGIYVGVRQIFIRFLMCNLSCAYCDSPAALIPQKTFRFEQTPGKNDFKTFNNPATVEQICGFIDQMDKPKGLHHSVSITGGEPLLQVDFLKNLLPKIKEKGLKVYLETNGTMHERLAEIIDLVDIVAMDIKLPSVSGCADLLSEHKKTLETAIAQETFVKIVYGKNTLPLEMDKFTKMVGEIARDIPVVLQPVTPTKEIKHGPTAEQAFVFHFIARKHLDNVRVIPQTHKTAGFA